jgi:hypothetical protein
MISVIQVELIADIISDDAIEHQINIVILPYFEEIIMVGRKYFQLDKRKEPGFYTRLLFRNLTELISY